MATDGIDVSFTTEQMDKVNEQDPITVTQYKDGDKEHDKEKHHSSSSEKDKEKSNSDKLERGHTTDRNRMTDEEYEAALRQPKHLRSRSLAEKIDFERQFRAKRAEDERKAQTDNVFSRLRETSDMRSQKLAEMEAERKAQIEQELARQKTSILEQAEAERAKKKLKNVQRDLAAAAKRNKSGENSADHSRKTSLELEEEEANNLAKGLTADGTSPKRGSRMSLGDRVAAQIMANKQNGKEGEAISTPPDQQRKMSNGTSAAPAYFSKASDELTNKLGISRQDSLRNFEQDKKTAKELQSSIEQARIQAEEDEKFEKQRRAKQLLEEQEKAKKAEEDKRLAIEEEKRNEVLRKKQEAIKAFEEKRRWEKLTNEQKAAEEAEKARIAAEEERKKKEEEDRLAEIARKKKEEEEATAAEKARRESEMEPVAMFSFHAEDSDDDETDKKDKPASPVAAATTAVQAAATTAAATATTAATTAVTEADKAVKDKAKAEYAAADAAANPEPKKVKTCGCIIS